MEAFGRRLGPVLRAGDLVLLTGPLGAGKTTLTRGIGEGLGIRGPVQSPTFVLARTHPSLVGGAPLVHVDAYRLNDALELDDLDLDFDGSVVVAEWAAGLVDESHPAWLEIVIERRTGADAGSAAAEVDLEADEPRTLTLRGPLLHRIQEHPGDTSDEAARPAPERGDAGRTAPEF
ncbi:tRNA (adenosine(37)-N6)-threonylcarbamoyltransferase complex ATPase subunit type 1 TsaE [Agromyces mediolanus]|nr:tRNA (adenosine(37)-N6)-threonylcarbamoyltransferase complex ATPase subunit type 1 TsaE [Agromyces mediolanus]MCM3655717.1 tRNA (adenosine(37)-N6)-threonylcarbamoyltransferase complex ATPase subunit type 1 TsaE [Agromyces mediolanus]